MLWDTGIRKCYFSLSHPHHVAEYYMHYNTACYCTYISHCSIVCGLTDNALGMPWKRNINANELRRNVKRAHLSQQQLFGAVVWTQQNEKKNSFKHCGCAVRARLRRSDIAKDSRMSQSLCKRNRLITEPKLRLGAFLERFNGAFVVLLEVLRCCYITTTLRFYCVLSELRRVIYASSKCAP